MSQMAKLFKNGRSQAVRLPVAYRFDTERVFLSKNPETGDVILSRKPMNWDFFLEKLKILAVNSDFLSQEERNQIPQNRDPFKGWVE
ncbi:antitoxin [unidentified bacterial endosymbiont]|uniref:antitoxin n=1 Tax=unidentified bacterial endosymbiont TaxID=2355 RepID=UPI00209FEA97|nr:AbrB/MazE/SpoVT family DNA-binding domain-containing protein [unidentified bacterial endosymbiont]